MESKEHKEGKTMSNQKNVIEQIRQDIERSRTVRLWQDSIHMLSTISQSVFSRSAHFILELLQNAEDAGSLKGAGPGEMEIRISPSRIRISHNGKPFGEPDVDAICGVRSNKKPEQGTLGYLGIGFKSVFKVSDCPQIHSGNFHFKFDKNVYKDSANEPWQIMPIWIDSDTEANNSDITTFILPFRSSEVYKQTLEELEKLDVHIFLFLRWLKKIQIINETDGKTILIENHDERDGIVTLRKNDIVHRFVVFRKSNSVPLDVMNDPALEFYKRQQVKQREIVLAFGVDEEDNLCPIEDASALGSVSSFLPLIEEKSGVKFLIQSDFLVQPGREAIQYELSWNCWLTSEAAKLAEEAIETFKKHPKWKNQFLPIFNFTKYWGQPSFEKLFKPKLHDPLMVYLLNTEIYPTSSGHIKPESAVHIDKKLQTLIKDDDLPFIFSGQTDLALANPNLDISDVPKEIQDKVQNIDLGQVARNRSLLDERRKATNCVDWFCQLYEAMAESNQDFRYEVIRTKRGRYSTRESPIYILTDNNSIQLANEVSFRQMPEEVLQLREKFFEINKLLSSYQLIHPELETPALCKFFGEHTHVQSIDYGKICHDVFLPMICINTQAPSKDEIYAITRLLQKGPQINVFIWIVTNNGNIKPSNQVYFGTDYSPSEDWEKNVRYSPEIEFLNIEYLKNCTKDELPAWKKFFRDLGVKDMGDRPNVEDFAIEFVKDKLSSELENFVSKDRQRYGYDLEAKRCNDGVLIKLEVKGRKKDEAIELYGNEPTTAQQSFKNNEPFWVCIVPGIPEHPELWIVEDVITIGEYNILTIPVSKWKSNGRRII